MSTLVRLSLLLSLCSAVACDKDDTAEETGGESSTDTTDATTDTGGELVPCGDIECAANQACLTFPQAPLCTNNPDGAACPPGTRESQCGGDGQPCCCEPPAPTVTECVDPGCEGPVDCACLIDVCIPECTSTATPGVFICEAPPPP